MNDKRLKQRGTKNGKPVWTGRTRIKHGDGPQQPRFRFVGNKKEAERAWVKWLASIEDGSYVATDNSTFGKYLDEFLAAAKSRLSGKTWERFECMARVHIIPTLGRIPLQRLTTSRLNKAYAQWRESGLSGQTVIHHHRFIHRALVQALKEGRVRQNVAAITDRPKASRREARFLGQDEIASLVGAATNTPYQTLVAVALATGARRGELLGLKWSDVDLEQRTIAIRRSLEQVRFVRERDASGKVLAVDTFIAEKTPKNGRARVVSISASAVDVLRRHRTAQVQCFFANGWGRPNGETYVFPGSDGKAWTPHKVTDGFRELAVKANLAGASFHSLRHTCASLLLAQGVHPKVVQEMLGHSSVAITMDLYSHATPSLQADAAARLDSILRPSIAVLAGAGA